MQIGYVPQGAQDGSFNFTAQGLDENSCKPHADDQTVDNLAYGVYQCPAGFCFVGFDVDWRILDMNVTTPDPYDYKVREQCRLKHT